MNTLSKLKECYNGICEKIMTNSGFEFYYNRGIDYFNKKSYQKAIKLFEKALEKPPIQPQVYYNMALSYQHLKIYANAITYYTKFLEARPSDYDGEYNLALIYYSTEDYEKAIELFEKCLNVKKDEDGVKAITLAYLSGDMAEKAFELAEKVMEIEKNGKKLYYTIAKVFENKNSLTKDFTFIDRAIEMYDKLATLEPKNFNTYLSISICYAKKGEWQNSVRFCKKALEVNPNSYECNNQMGLVYYCCNEIEDAVKHYEIALSLKPKGDYRIYSNLAYAYEKRGELKKAIKIFNKLLNKFPKYPARDEIKNHVRILKTLNR